jgi:hypothetical protein
MADGAPMAINPADPVYRAKVAQDAQAVAELTAKLAVVAKILPGPVGRVFAFAIGGVEKSHQGKVRPTGDTALNFLPAPFGYMPAGDYGLRKNYYLPPGASTYIPPIADQLGLGLPEQRAEDAARQNRIAQNLVSSDLAAARAAVADASPATLASILQGQGGFTPAGRIFATSGASFQALQIAAGERVNALTRQQPASTATAPVLAPLTPEQVRAAALAGTLSLVLLQLLQSQYPPDP